MPSARLDEQIRYNIYHPAHDSGGARPTRLYSAAVGANARAGHLNRHPVPTKNTSTKAAGGGWPAGTVKVWCMTRRPPPPHPCSKAKVIADLGNAVHAVRTQCEFLDVAIY